MQQDPIAIFTDVDPATVPTVMGWHGGQMAGDLAAMAGLDPWGDYQVRNLSQPWRGFKPRATVIIGQGVVAVVPLARR